MQVNNCSLFSFTTNIAKLIVTKSSYQVFIVNMIHNIHTHTRIYLDISEVLIVFWCTY